MGYTIIKKLVPASKYPLKCPYTMAPTRIVVHNTANDATARNEVSYMTDNKTPVGFHYAVDDKEVVQGILESRNSWNAGDGTNGTGNRKGIAIEICYSKSGGTKFKAAEANAVKFIATILKRKGWGVDKVTKHQDYNGKYCPHRTLDLGWARFKKLIAKELEADMYNGKTAEQWYERAVALSDQRDALRVALANEKKKPPVEVIKEVEKIVEKVVEVERLPKWYERVPKFWKDLFESIFKKG